VLGALLGTTAFADDCPDGDGKAKCLLGKAQQLKDSDPHAAARLFVASYRIEPKIDALAGYAAALEADKDFVTASEAFEKAVEEYEKIEQKLQADNGDIATINALQHRIEFVREELRRMGLNTAKVKIATADGKLPASVAKAMRKNGDDLRPSTPTVMYIHTGGDVVIFTFTDGKTAEKYVNASPGTITTIEIPPEPKDIVLAPTAPPAAPDNGDEERTTSYIVGAIGIVMLGGGIAYGAGVSGGNTAITASLTGLGGAGIGAAAVLYYWGDSKRKAAHKVAVVPALTRDGVGFAVGGSF